MADRPQLVERAFQLAASGDAASMRDSIRTLNREGYGNVGPTLDGRIVRKQLLEAMKSGAPR